MSTFRNVTDIRSGDAAIRQYRRNFVNSIEAHKRAIDQMHKDYAKRVAKLRGLANGIFLLAAGGFKDSDGSEPVMNQWDYDGERIFKTTAKDLPRIHELVGRLKATGVKSLVAKSPSKIWVYVEAVEFPGLQFKYQAKLPTSAKCKIVRQRQSVTSRRLVCSV